MAGWNVLSRSGVWATQGPGEAGRDLASTQCAFSPPLLPSFLFVLSLSVAHKCFGDSLHDVMFSDRVSLGILKDSVHSTISYVSYLETNIICT